MLPITASLLYQGRFVTLPLGTTHLDETLTATLACEQIGERGQYLVLTLSNHGVENSGRVQAVKTVDVTLPGPCRYTSLTGDDCGAVSFLPVETEITAPLHQEPLEGRSSNTTGFPYFDLAWPGGALTASVGWTGQWCRDLTPTPEGTRLQLGLCDCDLYLQPGESFRFPSALLVWGEELSENRRAFRSIMREHFSPKASLGEDFTLPIAIQCFDRYFQALSGAEKNDAWATEVGQKRTVDAACKCKGFDTLWLDAAWFREGFPHGVGNFDFSPGFPNGLGPVSDYAKEHGMQFLVWFEPERVYEGSDLYPRTELLLTLEPENPTRLFNLADPAARRWLTDTLKAMIRDNRIAVYRQDFNMDPLPYWRKADPEGRKGVTELRYINGLYEMWDELMDSFPGLWIDNCSSGGRRLDLETARRSVTLWRSDTGCFGEDDKMRVTHWAQNQTLGLSRYLPYHACAVWDHDPYTVRSNATQGLACNFDIFSPDFDFEAAAAILAEVQELREYWNGSFAPLTTAAPREDIWCAWQLSLEDRGAIYAFRREACPEPEQTIALTGLDPEARYALTFVREDLTRAAAETTGKALLEGLALTLPSPRESLILLYRKLP